MKVNRRKKNIIEKFLDEMVFVINSFIDNIFTLKGIELIKYLVFILIMVLITILASLPFELIKSIGNEVIKYVVPFGNKTTMIWQILVNALYAIVAMLLFVAMYHKEYKKITSLKIKDDNNKEIYKGLIILLAIPLFLLDLFTFVSLIMIIIINLSGISYYSLTIITVSIVIIEMLVTKIFIDYLKNKRTNYHIIKMVFYISIIVMIIGAILVYYELHHTKYYEDSIPNLDYSIHNETIETYINDKMTIECNGCNKEYDLIYDNKLDNEIIIEVNYYDDYAKVNFNKSNDKVTITGNEKSLFNSTMKDVIINNLRNKELFNYSLLFQKNLIIYINEKDESKLSIKIK